jgi:hypothetical protein
MPFAPHPPEQFNRMVSPGQTQSREDIAMADTAKGKAQKAGRKIAEKATEVEHKVPEQVVEGKEWAKDTAHKVGHRMQQAAEKFEHKAFEPLGEAHSSESPVKTIHEHMEVFGSCGNKLGRVDHVEGNMIKLTRNGSSDGMHHFIPTSWVSHVDDKVHLDKSCVQAKQQWQSE